MLILNDVLLCLKFFFKQNELVDRHVRAVHRLTKYFCHGFVSFNPINCYVVFLIKPRAFQLTYIHMFQSLPINQYGQTSIISGHSFGVPSFQPLLQSAEYGRTRRDLVYAEPILAACTLCNTTCYTRIRVYAHREAKYQKESGFQAHSQLFQMT